MNLKKFAIAAAATAGIVGTIGFAYAQTDTKNRNPDGTTNDAPQAAPAAGATGMGGTMPSNPATTPSTPGTMPSAAGTMPSTPGTMPGAPGTMSNSSGGMTNSTGSMPNNSGTVGTERAARADRN